MSRIFITGSADGLGRAAAGVLMGEGHDVVLHARSPERAAALGDLAAAAAGVVIGDLASAAETRDLAGQVNQIGRMETGQSSGCYPVLVGYLVTCQNCGVLSYWVRFSNGRNLSDRAWLRYSPGGWVGVLVALHRFPGKKSQPAINPVAAAFLKDCLRSLDGLKRWAGTPQWRGSGRRWSR